MKLIYLIPIAFILQSCKGQTAQSLPQNKDNNSLLWEISGNGLKKPSYLFGTFHLLCKDDIHLGTNLRQAVKNADEVYFELDMDDPSTMLGGLSMMNMPAGKTLKSLYTADEYTRLAAFFKDSLKANLGFFNEMKPMMLEAMLYPRMMPCKNPSGVEMELITVAKKENKEIKGLETVAFQASVFDSIPYDVQAKALLKDIDSMETYRIAFTKMMNAYKEQRTAELIEFVNDTAFNTVGENEDLLLKNRNLNWVKQLKTILKDRSIFMAVGAAHLFGDNGVIALLRKEGYKVVPVENVK